MCILLSLIVTTIDYSTWVVKQAKSGVRFLSTTLDAPTQC